ncbi:MAG: hypothetical protein BGO69_17580 [Bacteroidetes bacterium 46-16]|nr:MAG: hypothetical protein BGO69_17580 [Bacteroidetes bacterium 46-16]
MALFRVIYILLLGSLGVLNPDPLFANISHHEEITATCSEQTGKAPFAILYTDIVKDRLLAPQNSISSNFAKTSNGQENNRDICYDLARFCSYQCALCLADINKRSAEKYFTPIRLKDLFPKHWFW